MGVQGIRIQKNRIESYDFEEIDDTDVYVRGEIELTFEGQKCVSLKIEGVPFLGINDYRDLERLIKYYEG